MSPQSLQQKFRIINDVAMKSDVSQVEIQPEVKKKWYKSTLFEWRGFICLFVCFHTVYSSFNFIWEFIGFNMNGPVCLSWLLLSSILFAGVEHLIIT